MSEQPKKGKSKMDWSTVASHRDVDPGEELDERPDRVGREQPAPSARPRTQTRRVVKFAATYRLPERVLDLIDEAKAVAAEKGEKVSKEDAVAAAVEAHYGHLLPDDN